MKTLLALVVTMVATLALAPSSHAATPQDFTTGLANKVVAIIKSNTTEDAKEAKLIDLFHQNVDSAWMGRFVMGANYRALSAEQKTKFTGLYTDYVVYSYIPKFRLYSGEELKVNQVINEGDNIYTVKTTLETDKSSTGSVLVDYKLLKSGDSYKIVDIIGEGISLISTQRSDFAGALANGDVDGFLTKLQDKVDYIKSHPQTQLKKDNVAKTPEASGSDKAAAAPVKGAKATKAAKPAGKQLGE